MGKSTRADEVWGRRRGKGDSCLASGAMAAQSRRWPGFAVYSHAMSLSEDPSWREFLDRAAPNLDRNPHALVSGLVYASSTENHALALTVILAPTDQAEGPVSPRLVDYQGLRAFRGLVAPDKVQDLLGGLRLGKVPRGALPSGVDLDITLPGRAGRPFSFDRHSFVKRSGGARSFPFPHELLTGTGANLHDVLPPHFLAELGEQLPAAEIPFANLSALSRELGLAIGLQDHDSATVEILSPYWIAWEGAEPSLAEGTLRLKIASYIGPIAPHAILSIIPIAEAQADWRVRTVVGDNAWSTVDSGDGALHFEAVFKAQSPIPPSQVFLTFEGRRLDEFKVGLGSARVVAHALFDRDFELLTKRLQNTKNTDSFEEGVAWLLHLCGYSAARYGHKDVQGATDVVAFSDESIAIFAECTSKLPSTDKMKDLQTRANAFKRKMEELQGRKLLLARAVFLPIPRSEVSEDLRDSAHELQVTLVAQEDMANLLDGAIRGEDSRRAWAVIACCGPKFGSIYLE